MCLTRRWSLLSQVVESEVHVFDQEVVSVVSGGGE